ncbi:Uncharacterized protein dnl_57630 [Desulfonema limicola]|uniref:Uncharacterized protein n=1 Tax=Desulfonema limicola TaxID=45656 RepID=A0A975BDI0_9BACT|nr:hypothetical protein [Desulfonema limicola]QTA83361.1 Uncharacterized protein dnl_57630 [Desulfonema limicola]
MSFQAEYKKKFDDLNTAVHIDYRTQLKRDANGGNTVLFVYPPHEENLYINMAGNLYPDACFIDVSRLFVDYIESLGWDDFEDFYRAYESTPDQVFKNDDETSLFKSIIEKIQTADSRGKMSFVIRTGVLHGTGIVNQHIMDDSRILSLKQPLVFLYPAKIEKKGLLFLNFKPASKYRCKLVA